MSQNDALIVGAGSDIGQGIAEGLKKSEEFENIHLVSRNSFDNRSDTNDSILHNYTCDNEKESIREVLEEVFNRGSDITKIFICNGILHSDEVFPERRLEHISAYSMERIFRINSIVPMLWLAELINFLSKDFPSVVAVLNARVGSIDDNKLGGWYSYRASKTALNMLLKTTSIEYARRNRMVKLISFHPGTVDTKLSKPFQKNIPKDRIFSTDYAASQLLNIMNSISHDGTLDYLDWKGDKIPW